MMNINSDFENGTIIISDEFDVAATDKENETPYLDKPNDEYILSFDKLDNVKEFNRFTYDSIGLKENKYLVQYYRISRDENSWSEWLDLNINITNFPVVDSKDPMYLEIKWVRKGSSDVGSIRILEYKLEGVIDRDEIFLGEQAFYVEPGKEEIVKAPFIYKVFKLEDIQIINITGLDNVNIKYRFSQDNSRTWTEWEELTKENITTKRINPIRFFQIEYLIENNSASIARFQDINLIGDFQNVSKDYKKSNLFGIRECCKSNQVGYIDENGNYILNDNLNTTGGSDCDDTSSTNSGMTDTEKAQLYNPYAQNEATQLLEKLSSDSEQVLGHKVTYFATDPDEKGQDHTLNEYQLYNVVCEGDLKLSIAGNNFPDSQIKMNIFDLDLFDSMEAHVTKQQFKEIFGVQRRPSKEDFIHFCQVNRIYQVDHAQQFRNFNNSAVYYKLILKKYSQKANVQSDIPEISNNINELTKNTTIDELFGKEIENDKKSIANKKEQQPLTRDPIRLEYFAEIDKELIENSTTIVSKSNYDLSTVRYGGLAVQYKNFNSKLEVSDNISLQIWFSINNYLKDEEYKFISVYDNDVNKGWKTVLKNDSIIVSLNENNYTFDLSGFELQDDPEALEEDVWYCYVLNINQRQRYIENYIYKRNVDLESDADKLNSTVLRKEYYHKQDIEPIDYNIDINPNILASDMKVTNIRLFNDVIPENVHNKVLNQYIIGDDSKHLIFGDNANLKLSLPNFPLNENY